MADHSCPSALRWLIGAELAHYRNAADLSLADLSRLVEISKSKLGHLESGRLNQYPVDISKILKACGAERQDIDRLNSLTGRAEEGSWVGAWTDVVPDWLRTMVGLESLARNEFVFEPILLPGLIQTESYARELTIAASRVRPDHSERLVEFRMQRARLLSKDEPLELHAVFNEQALNLRVGDQEILRDQYLHLLKLAELPNVTLQVMRPEGGPHSAVTGQFMLLEFADARPISYVEMQDGAVFVNDSDRVRTYSMSTQSLERIALSPGETSALIERLIR
ncbi:helix-turn-helix domain-containing protein [Solihabitans fulvus]|uniref:Helix-turn-helix domain-containing protein n=1 Tax=Solihabitans fulvus TaxID=1892852 RepID=A0A5B2XUG1_9PSEU|nr:helix-turn-helix transcriptional regulator [Solihabitans fulvus]KAA2266963.1 helix-turn-helix domain-containing protein [Solihabitans fulvus]